MATSDQEQRSVLVPQHKRIAQGEKLNGTSYGARGQGAPASQGKSQAKGGLSSLQPRKR